MNFDDDPSDVCGEMDIPTFHRWLFIGLSLRLVMCFLLIIMIAQNCH